MPKKNSDIDEIILSWKQEHGFHDYFSLNIETLIPRIKRKIDVDFMQPDDLNNICLHYIKEDINKDRSNIIHNISTYMNNRSHIIPYSYEYNMELLKITPGTDLFNLVYEIHPDFLYNIHNTSSVAQFIIKQIHSKRFDIAEILICNLLRDKKITPEKLSNMLYPFLYMALFEIYSSTTISFVKQLPYFNLPEFMKYKGDNQNNLFHFLCRQTYSTHEYLSLSRHLLDFSVDINERNAEGRTPLLESIKQQNSEYFSILLSLGAEEKGTSGLTIPQLIDMYRSNAYEQNKIDNLYQIEQYYSIHKEKQKLKEQITVKTSDNEQPVIIKKQNQRI